MQTANREPTEAGDRSGRGELLLSIVTPAYNEADNLPVLHARIVKVMEGLDEAWEWVVVDDHSTDGTWEVVKSLAARDHRTRGTRLARNCGSHMALLCCLQQARGEAAIALAGDLQDPPELIPELIENWRGGSQVVWAARASRRSESRVSLLFSRLYYAIMRKTVGIREMPESGADFFLVSRRVLDALRWFKEANVSLLALITWMGFRQDTVFYDKEARLHGESGWTVSKKLKLAVDSIVSFSYLPIRLMSYTGFGVAAVGFLYAAFVVFNAFHGNPVQGWASLMVVILLLGGTLMVMLGVLGEYLWRALDESRGRPRFIVEEATDTVETAMPGLSEYLPTDRSPLPRP